MKTMLAICLFLLLCGPAAAADNKWFSTPERKDIALEVMWQGVHVLDWGQTLEIARHPQDFYECNPLIGRHPSVGRVNTFMLASTVVHPLVSYALPKPYRTWWQMVTISVTTGLVANNYNIGLRVRF